MATLFAQFKDVWRPLVPMAGMGLVIFVLWSYAYYIRYLLAPRWCCDIFAPLPSDGNVERDPSSQTQNEQDCAWMRFHDAMATYLGTMILFHYTCTVFRSPGVVLWPSTPVVSKEEKICIRWSSWKGQGGILGLNAVCRPDRERQRLAYYGKLYGAPSDTSNNMNGVETSSVSYFIPELESTFCSKCQLVRPPRCRHCSTCQRCILQYDHHCVWVNQCIGYNNYRNFFLMLSYFTAGCWYGVAMLSVPFLEPLHQQVQYHGGLWGYLKANYFMLIPLPLELLKLVLGSDDDGDDNDISKRDRVVAVVTTIAYLLMLFAGFILLSFFATHASMAAQGRTTLEHRLIREEEVAQQQQRAARNQSSSPPSTSKTTVTAPAIVNPFDQGSAMKNIQQILGPNVLCWFLPIPVDPPRPFLPSKDKNG